MPRRFSKALSVICVQQLMLRVLMPFSPLKVWKCSKAASGCRLGAGNAHVAAHDVLLAGEGSSLRKDCRQSVGVGVAPLLKVHDLLALVARHLLDVDAPESS